MLNEDAARRRFNATPEPNPEVKKSLGTDPVFVVQKHAASHLHYDFRLEVNGVLVSWAIPKGPALNPHTRRLAIKVEDHPLDYANFEGSIPNGQYGGGEVIVWDHGTYRLDSDHDPGNDQAKIAEAIEDGKLEIVLSGTKLKGSWVMVHSKDQQWLLMKRQDEFASINDVTDDDHSVISGKTVDTISDHIQSSEKVRKSETQRKLASAHPPKPMLLTERARPFSDPAWELEIKLDGIRAIVEVDGSEVKIFTRNGNEVSERFPILKAELGSMGLADTTLDGEIVQLEAGGLPSFQELMKDFQAGMSRNSDYCIFDLLKFKGKSLVAEPWQERRNALERLGLQSRHVRVVDSFPERGDVVYENALKLGFEGVVGKKLSSRYEEGVRSPNWIKVKEHRSAEFVVVGYSPGKGARATAFGALLLGQLTPNGLQYMGNVGGGFNDRTLVSIKERLEKISVDASPLTNPPKLPGVKWVSPVVVVEVRYMAQTKGGKLRFPTFMRLRPDKAVTDVLPAEENVKTKNKDIDATLEALSTDEDELHIEVDGAKLHFSHLSKKLWPEVSKRDLIRFYATVSETLLPYLANRPLSFVRCPDGVEGERFFQKHWDKGRPQFVDTVSIWTDSNRAPRDFIVCNNLPTLMWLGQMAAVELNPWNSQTVNRSGEPSDPESFADSKDKLEESILNFPDYLVLDLDPHFGGKATGWKKEHWVKLVEVGATLRELLEQIGLKSFAKTSGKSGLHLYVPVTQEQTYEEIRAAAEQLAVHAQNALGAKITLVWKVENRPNGVFIDVNQNGFGKTMAAPYSPRAHPSAGVSMPVTWDEVKLIDPTEWTVLTAAHRLKQKSDLWQGMKTTRQKLIK